MAGEVFHCINEFYTSRAGNRCLHCAEMLGCMQTKHPSIFNVADFNCPILCMVPTPPWMNWLFKAAAETKGNKWYLEGGKKSLQNLGLSFWFWATWLKMWILDFPPQPCCSGGWSGYTLFCIRWWVIAIKSLTEIHSPSICWYVIGVFFLRRMRMYQEQQVSSRKALWGLKPSVQQRKVSR